MNKKLNTLLIISILSSVLCVSAYWYFYNSLSGSKLDAENFREESKASEAKLKNLQSIEQNLKQTVSEGDVISSLFLGQDSVVTFIQTIEGLMKETGVSGSVDSVTEDKNSELDALGKEKLNLVVSANGKWSGMVNLLGLLERLPYKSTLNSFSLVYAKTEDSVVDGKKKSGVAEWQLKAGMVVWAAKKTADDVSGNTAGNGDTKTSNQ